LKPVVFSFRKILGDEILASCFFGGIISEAILVFGYPGINEPGVHGECHGSVDGFNIQNPVYTILAPGRIPVHRG